MKTQTKKTVEIVQELLDSPHCQRLRNWARIQVFDAEPGALISVFLLDKKGFVIDFFSMQTNDDGFVHPGQVIGLIIDAFQVATERMKYRSLTFKDLPES